MRLLKCVEFLFGVKIITFLVVRSIALSVPKCAFRLIKLHGFVDLDNYGLLLALILVVECLESPITLAASVKIEFRLIFTLLLFFVFGG